MKPWYSGVYSMAESSAEEGAIFAQGFGVYGQLEEWCLLLTDAVEGELRLFLSTGRRAFTLRAASIFRQSGAAKGD